MPLLDKYKGNAGLTLNNVAGTGQTEQHNGINVAETAFSLFIAPYPATSLSEIISSEQSQSATSYLIQ